MVLNIAVFGSTRGTDLQCIIDAIQDGSLKDVNLRFVLSNKKDAFILERAKNYNPIFLDPRNLSRETYDQFLNAYLMAGNVDLVLLIGWMRILSREFVEKWGHKTMNIHPSLLPAFAGGMDLNVHREVIKRGCKVSGASLIFINDGADTGPIIDQQIVRVDYDIPSEMKQQCRETQIDFLAERLKTQVQNLEGKMLLEAIENFRDYKYTITDGMFTNVE